MKSVEITAQMLRFSNELADLRKLISDQADEIKELKKFKEKLEKTHSVPVNVSPMVRHLETSQAEKLFWVCTPIQHAVIQLILAGFSNQEIADRLDTSLASIKTRFRHLCGRLSIKGREDLKTNYKPIFDAADAEEYKTSARIIKSWAEKYGKLTFKQAKSKDPYHKDICETHYRGVTMT